MNPNEAREMRGFILNMLQINYPNGCSEKLIEITLNENQFSISPSVIKTHIEYLEEKGYVRVEEVRSMGVVRTVVYLTAKGIDLMERSIPEDPGIILPLE